MSITSNNQTIKVHNLSGHSMSHRNTLTSQVGTLTPILVEEVCPNTKCHLKTSFSVKMPPLASETFANIDYCIEAFFVPHRLLVNGFTDIVAGRNKLISNSNEKTSLPVVHINPTNADDAIEVNSHFGPGTLSDYLGLRGNIGLIENTHYYFSPLPYLAYHKIYDYWYRNKLIQKEVFKDNSDLSLFSKYVRYNSGNYLLNTPDAISPFMVSNDGVNLLSLRQRNFDSDYFTTATASQQLGDPNNVTIDITTNKGSLSIASLRAANSLQQFAERNNLCGVDDVNFYKAMYGAELSYGVAQHPVLLGSSRTPIYVNGIFQTAGPGNSSQSNNPFTNIGTQYGSANGAGVEVVIKDFTAQEFGYIFVIGSLVPKVSYSSGTRRYLHHHISEPYLGSDFANPILQNVGPQPIFMNELRTINASETNSVFGYQMRYAEWISHPDEIHGQFMDGETLDSFVLQRSFPTGKPTINSDFLDIPINYLDQIFAATVDTSNRGFSYWVDMLHEWNIVSPIANFVVPSLQDPAVEHGHDVTIRKNGAPMI